MPLSTTKQNSIPAT